MIEDLTQTGRHWRAFDADWFTRHQSLLLRIANAPIVGQRLRRALKLKARLPVEIITPDAVHYRQDGHQSVATFYSGPVLSRRIYEAYKPIWWGLHYYDELFADRFAPELAYGFDQLTVYTGAGEVQNFDGIIDSIGSTYTDTRNGSNLSINHDSEYLIIEASRTSLSPLEYFYSRAFVKFNLTTLAANPIITSALFKVAGQDNSGVSTFFMNVYSAFMADNATTLSSSDWTSTTNSADATQLFSRRLSEISITSNDYTSSSVSGLSGINPEQTAQLQAAAYAYLASQAGGYLPMVLRHQRDTSGNIPGNVSYLWLASADSDVDLPPIFEITYSRGVYPIGIGLTTGFGLPTATVSSPGVKPVGIASTVAFGQPTISGSLQIAYPVGIASTAAVGTPTIVRPLQINPIGIASTATIGTPVIATIQAVGIASTAGVGEIAIAEFPDRIVRPEPIASTVAFGLPLVERVAWPIAPAGIASTLRIGLPSITIPYPDGSFATGPYITRLIDQPLNYGRTIYEFEDGGASVNVQPCGVRQWVLEYEGLTAIEISQLVAHWNAMRGRSGTFSFYHRRDEVRYTARYVSMSIPARIRTWNNQATVTLEGLI